MTSRDTRGDTQRVTIAEAASILGVKEPAIRKRIQRGTLRHDKGEDGRTYVYLDTGSPTGMDTGVPTGSPTGVDERDERVQEFKDQVRYLREVIATRDEEIRRRDVIISQLTSRIPEIEPPEPQREAESASESSPSTEPPPEPQTGSERRSWLRRWFGQ